jgi:methionyl aminopeptidase
MAVAVRSEEEIHLMREAGRMLSEVHASLRKCIRPGITTEEINRYGEELIRQAGGIPNFLGYGGFPASVCVSVNDEVVHGIPSERRLLEGDIVSIDTGLSYKGWHADAARTYGVGEISEENRKLIDVTEQSFFEGMKYARAGFHLYDISKAIGSYAEERGYGVVRVLTGHGIGRHLHEKPVIPNFAQKGRGVLLVPGMTIAVEPMINLGSGDVDFDEMDGWTVTTSDGLPSAHYENTVLITDGEPEYLTLRREI